MAAPKKVVSMVPGKKAPAPNPTPKPVSKPAPAKKAAPAPKPVEVVEEPMPVAVMSVDQIADPDLREAIREHASTVFDLKSEKKEIERQLDGVKEDKKKGVQHIPGLVEELVEMLREAGVKVALLDLGDGRVLETTLYRGVNSQLSREALLAAGVPADVIAACYQKKPYYTVQSKVKGESDE